MKKSKQLLTSFLFLITPFCYGQGVGSMSWELKDDDYENKMLLSLVFNDKTYAPRHRNLPLKKFWYNSPIDVTAYLNQTNCSDCKINIVTDSVIMESFTRPVELYVIDKKGKRNLTNPGYPIFVSLHSFTEIEVELSLLKSDHQFMRAIDDRYFVLVTTFRVKVAGQTSNARYPILFLFKEEQGDNFPIKVSSFTPLQENGNKVLEMKIEGKKVIFLMSNKKAVTLTFDPEPGYKIRWMSSDGEFILEQ